MGKKRIIASAASIILAMSATAWAVSPAMASSRSVAHYSSVPSGQIDIGLSADPPKLDPSLSSALVDRQVMINIYDTLFQLSAKGQLEPDLATGYTVSKNGLTYTLHLRKGVLFQDGTPFNAAAVKFNLQRDSLKISPRASSLSSISAIDVTAPYTVVLHLSKPFSPLLNVLTGRAGMMVSPTAVKKEGANFLNDPVGTGPYEFVKRVTGSYIDLKANPHYWVKGEPHFATVEYKIFTDPNVELLNLQSGAVQFIDTVPPQQVYSLSSNASYTVINKPSYGYQGIYLNVKAAPFTNVYLREAVDHAINRNLLVGAIFRGTAVAGNSPFGPASPAYVKAEDAAPRVDPSLVRSLLKKGGKPAGFTFTMQTAASPLNVQIAEILQSMLSPYGIKMKIDQLDFGTMLNNSTDGNFTAMALGWSGRLDPDQDIYSFFYTGAPLNSSQYSNPKVDLLLNRARAVSNMAQRKALYAQAMAIINHDAPYVFLYHPNNVLAYSNTIKGFVYIPDGLIRVATLS